MDSRPLATLIVAIKCDRIRPAKQMRCATSTCTHRMRHLLLSIEIIIALYLSFLPPSVESLRNRYGAFTVISAKPCQNALGQFGTCMFMWDCIKSEGLHLGTCSDRFLFGSCCHHNTTAPPVTTTTAASPIPSNAAGDQVNFNSTFGLGAVDEVSSSSASSSYSQEPASRPYEVSATTTLPPPTPSTTPMPTRIFLQSASTLSQSPQYSDHTQQQQQTQPTINEVKPLNQSGDIYGSGYPMRLNSSLVFSHDHHYQQQPQQLVESGHYQAASPSQQTSSKNHSDWSSDSLYDQQIGQQASSLPTPVPTHDQLLTTTTTTTTTAATTTMSTSPAASLTPQETTTTSLGQQDSSGQFSSFSQPGAEDEVTTMASLPSQQQQMSPFISYQPVVATRPPAHMSAFFQQQQQQAQAVSTQRPSASSWLSRPSLIANAIFHSFKPYLNPHRQRPTYRPTYMNGAFRPQHHNRPLQQQQQQPQRPSVIASGPKQPPGQSMDSPLAGSNESKISTSYQTPNATMLLAQQQQDNNDHHIVNPSSSSMTDRQRPMDTDNAQKHGHHYEILGANTTSLGAYAVSSSGSSSNAFETTTQAATLGNTSYSLSEGALFQSSNGSQSTQVGDNLISQQQPADLLFNLHHQQQQQTAMPSHHQPTSGDYNLFTTQGTPTMLANQTSSAVFPEYPLIAVSGGGPPRPSQQNHFQQQQSGELGGHSDHHFMSTANSIGDIHGISSSDNGGQHFSTTPAATTTSSSPFSQLNLSSSHQNQGQVYQSGDGMLILGNIDDQPNVVGHHATAAATTTPSSQTLMPNTTTEPSQVITSSFVTREPTYTTTSLISGPAPVGTSTEQPVAPHAITTTTTRQPATEISVNFIPSGGGGNSIRKPGSLQDSSDNLRPAAPAREATCGVTALYPQTKVVGGKNAAFGAWPWQVSVRKVSFFGFSSTHRCGGAVISSEWIATAGHCVEDLALQSIRIRVGEYDFSSMGEPYPHIERAARRKVVHPKYNFYTYENDLALVQLDQPLQFPPHVTPICLPPDNIDLLGRNATVTGWGRLNEGGTLPTILQEVRVPIVSNDKCKDMFLNAGRPEYIPDIFLCAGYEEGGRDSCQGDSGGPLQVRGDDGKWFLAGIISWGIGCAEQNLPGVCTRISRFKLWMQSTMNSTS